MFENRVNNKYEFDTELETNRIKINNFQPGKRYILNSHCYANVFEP